MKLLAQLPQKRREKYIVYSSKIGRGWEAAPTTISVGGIPNPEEKVIELGLTFNGKTFIILNIGDI